MRFILLHFLKVMWRERIAWFWPIWIVITGAAAVSLAWAVRHTATSPLQIAKQAPVTSTRWHDWSGSAVAVLILLALFLVGYVGVTLKWEDFADNDESAFTLFTLRGHSSNPSIWRDLGPLARGVSDCVEIDTMPWSSLAG